MASVRPQRRDLLTGAAVVTAPTASGAGVGCPETRVKALDVLSWPCVGARRPETARGHWGNRPRRDGKAVGNALARCYDPFTAQFLTVDPDVATTLSPYGYVAGDPLNAGDPSGLCGWNPLDWLSCLVPDSIQSQRELAHPTAGQELQNLANFAAILNMGDGGGEVIEGCDLATEGAGSVAPDLENLSPKIVKQMTQRGWTPEQIQEAFDNGEQVNALNKATGDAATRYINPGTGQSVVIVNGTGEVIHVGGAGFLYGPGSGDVP